MIHDLILLRSRRLRYSQYTWTMCNVRTNTANECCVLCHLLLFLENLRFARVMKMRAFIFWSTVLCTITSAWYRTPEILLSTSQTTRLFHSSVFELLWVVALQNANRDGALCIHKMQHRNRQWYRFQSLMLTGTTGVHRIMPTQAPVQVSNEVLPVDYIHLLGVYSFTFERSSELVP